MHSKLMYVIATTENESDVKILSIYDGEVFTLATIIAGLRKQLRNFTTQFTIMKDHAYVDVLDDGKVTKTYSIIGKETFVTKVH